MSRRERIAPFRARPDNARSGPARAGRGRSRPPAPLVRRRRRHHPRPALAAAPPWGGVLLRLLGLEPDLLAELFARSVWLGGAPPPLIGITLAGALGLIGHELNSACAGSPGPSICASTASACCTRRYMAKPARCSTGSSDCTTAAPSCRNGQLPWPGQRRAQRRRAAAPVGGHRARSSRPERLPDRAPRRATSAR